jgi:hypothetical protein
MSTRKKVFDALTLLTALAALAVAVAALATPGPRGPAGQTGAMGETGEIGPRGPKGPRGRAADTSALESRLATLERQLNLVQQVQCTTGLESGTTGLESPSSQPDVPSYAGDLDCSDYYPQTDFPTPAGDPNGLDADGDGIACES